MKARTRPLIAVAVLSVLTAATTLAQPLVVNRLITLFGSGHLAGWVALLIALLLLGSILAALQKYLLTRTAEQTVLDLRKRIVRRMIRLPLRVYDTSHSGDLTTRLSADTSMVRAVFTGGAVDAVGSVFLFVGAIIAMATIDPPMLVVVLAVAGTGVAVVILASRRIRSSTVAAQDAVGRLAASMERALFAIRTVKATRAESQLEKGIVADAEEAYDRGLRIARTEALLSPVSGVVVQAALLIVIGIGGMRVASGALSLADLVTFVLFLFMLINPLGRVFTSLVTIRGAQGAMERINRLMGIPIEGEGERPSGGAVEADGADTRTPHLSVQHVTFSYDDGAPVLDDVSFRLEEGATTAIVGPSGSGKSTLLSLIERFYEPDFGRIELGGEDISTVDRDHLRGRIAYVEQNPVVLSGTVRENLQLGFPTVTEEACQEVLDMVNLRERFERDDGLDTVLGERGVNLSGGEKQRLSLARALLSPAQLLLLDEPTSAMDSGNEEAIQIALKQLGGTRTMIVVAHRLATVQQADQIIVLDEGSVAAVGDHQELLRTSSLYQGLARNQFVRDR
ncbi:hypothetical protein HMPREF3162_05120 [Brevibacterium sp. HMSC07C04]|nr:hypothetical protein HMPREF3162_05120 [Brevibacterium sp. HMSC07C04]